MIVLRFFVYDCFGVIDYVCWFWRCWVVCLFGVVGCVCLFGVVGCFGFGWCGGGFGFMVGLVGCVEWVWWLGLGVCCLGFLCLVLRLVDFVWVVYLRLVCLVWFGGFVLFGWVWWWV